jgi:pyridoxamine 5'-phosphate oxidase
MAAPHDIDSNGPLDLFDDWLDEAKKSEPNDPNAAALATADMESVPTVRMVLAKRVGELRFCFFTNAESRKGMQLKQNPRAAMCFHWKTLRRQVRVEGSITELPAAEVDQYFHSRSRASQVGAAVSSQSRPLESRELLETQVARFAAEHPSEIPRPPFWRGFHLDPDQVEFWIDGENRLHDRFLFTKTGAVWQRTRLYP